MGVVLQLVNGDMGDHFIYNCLPNHHSSFCVNVQEGGREGGRGERRRWRRWVRGGGWVSRMTVQILSIEQHVVILHTHVSTNIKAC